jgi:hypothetical protein
MSTGKFMTIVPNYLSPLEFRISIKRLPNVQFFTQRSMIPSINVSPVIQPTRFNPVYRTSDNVNYGNLDLTFIIDEDMKNYLEIFNWIISSTFPENHNQFRSIANSEEGLFSDISVLVMNSKKNSNIEISYNNCFPISLSDVSLDTTQNDVIYPEATATFSYDTFSIKQLT